MIGGLASVSISHRFPVWQLLPAVAYFGATFLPASGVCVVKPPDSANCRVGNSHDFPLRALRSDLACCRKWGLTALVCFVPFVVSCHPPSIDRCSQTRINHKGHEVHEGARIEFAWIRFHPRFSSRARNLHARNGFARLQRRPVAMVAIGRRRNSDEPIVAGERNLANRRGSPLVRRLNLVGMSSTASGESGCCKAVAMAMQQSR